MQVLETTKDLKVHFQKFFSKKVQIGFVATMGALHEGHISLVKKSKVENEITVVSIFVNPTQFDKKEDLEKYPRTINEDLTLLKKNGCDYVFIPSVEDIYEKDVVSLQFDFDGLENEMEGRHRLGHFDGVGTIVKAFFEIIKPSRAYFGEKDFQQLMIIKKMTQKHQLNVNVIGCPIYREKNGLAMSSRNKRLSDLQRKEASIIYKTLTSVRERLSNQSVEDINTWVNAQFKNNPYLELEYFMIADENTLKTTSSIVPKKQYRAFIAAFAGSVRLIDNMSL